MHNKELYNLYCLPHTAMVIMKNGMDWKCSTHGGITYKMLFENTTVMMMVIIFTDLERTVTGQQE